MEKKIIIGSVILIIIISLYFIFRSSEYEGYWCNYTEEDTLRITLDDDTTDKQRTNIEDKINSYNNLSSLDLILKEAFSDGDAKDTYIVYFTDREIEQYTEELSELSGVDEVIIDTIKSDVSLYEIIDKNDYKYSNAIDVEEDLKESGKYRTTKNSLIFEDSELFIQDNYLCGDENCLKIFAKTDEFCD